MQSTTNQVRQILTNELGLTREFVREVARKYVEEIVSAKINHMVDNGDLAKLVASHHTDTVNIRHEIICAVKEEVQKWLVDHIEFKVKQPEQPKPR